MATERWKFSSDYFSRSLNVLETALSQVAAYKSWRAFDPGKGYPVDMRYAAMPMLTKEDIRQHFPQGMVPTNRNIEQGLADGEIEFVATSGTIDIRVTMLPKLRPCNTANR